MKAHRGFLKATVALANKLTRIIRRVLADDINFNMQKTIAINQIKTLSYRNHF